MCALKDPSILQITTFDTLASYAAITAKQILSTEEKIKNLNILKNRDFRPIKEDALIIPLSGKALGGMPRGAAQSATEKRKKEIKNLKNQEKDLQKNYGVDELY